MKCQAVNRRISGYLDGILVAEERRRIEDHLAGCAVCALEAQQLAQLRTRLRALPARIPPDGLNTRLHVLASRERARVQVRADYRALARHWFEHVSLAANNMMRPLALPFAGGLLSALVLFSMLVPQFPKHVAVSDDVPTVLTTEAGLKSALSFGLGDNDIVVDVLVDESGRLLDYWVPDGQRWGADPQLRRSIENTLLCTQFTPATMFGQPASGKLRITLRRSLMEVKG
ncbi:MAG: zf-HC2 domain-containing protein [Acidobacteria bacterium]|nr:zf-HC2 domain-containing protein [Acidobacteriota bacterium]